MKVPGAFQRRLFRWGEEFQNKLRRHRLFRVWSIRNRVVLAFLALLLLSIFQIANNTQPWVVALLLWIWEQLSSFLPPFFISHPYWSILLLFLIYFGFLVGVAFFETRQPRGITASINPSEKIGWRGVRYLNSTGFYLNSCTVILNWLTERNTGKPAIENRYRLIWDQRDDPTEIDLSNTQDAKILFVTPTGGRGGDFCQIRILGGAKGLPLGEYEAEIVFSGADNDGASIQRTSWFYFDVTESDTEIIGISL
jgi:hypothetical protein